MIAFLNGPLAGISLQAAYVEVGGVGYQVLMSQLSLSRLPEAGSPVRVLTYLQAGESGLALYGFLREDERALFEKLITVSGVGPKVALAALSSYEPADFVAAVAAGDIGAVQKVPGVGKKTASRIILELKGSLDPSALSLFDAAGEPSFAGAAGRPATAVSGSGAGGSDYRDVAHALMGMGFSPAEVDLALEDVPAGSSETAALQHALRRLGGR
ncbi:MAG: Holliday junction branch migration protein RuvA [Eggerthellaceae bacterium]|nr:Holliday junction branch migration protein RuvA [Eggerthellaceae bacterium]